MAKRGLLRYNSPYMIYDRFQKEAIGHIEQDHSVIVSAPTGSGKTVIAEYVIKDCLARGRGVIYTAPIKALSNQKYRDFKESFGDKIGILTGDVSINSTAPVLIMTTEIFRNKLLEAENDLERYSWIIFDEAHYLDDYERGTVWEESIVFLPAHMRMLALSATIPNIEEFARWIQSIHKTPIKIVLEGERPVPLHFFYQCQGAVVDKLEKVREVGYKNAQTYHHRGRRYSKHIHVKPNRPTSLIKHLHENNRLPCIYFVFGRRRCERLADEMRQFNFLNKEDGRKINDVYGRLCEKFDLEGEKSAMAMRGLIGKGIAYHHAGMLPTLKEAIERLFTSRLIKVIFTTETFALGINMPARTVVFDELSKYYGRYHGILKTRDFYQMAGRAGRRGIDAEGFVYSRLNPRYISLQELKSVIYGRPEAVISKFNASYATILNLYEKYNEKLYDVYPLSFHYFQQNTQARKKALKLLSAKVKILKDLGHISNGCLTEKGIFASKVYGYELPLAELYSEGILEELSETELGIICTSLIYEPRKGIAQPPLGKKARALLATTIGIWQHIQHMEKRSGIYPPNKRGHYGLSPALEAWMRNEPFDSVLQHTEADEGEIIRYFRMAVQMLREILDAPVSAQLKGKLHKAISLINRDIIDAEKQLRR